MDISKSFLKNFFTSIVFIATFGFGQTDVSGTISSNTTWTVSGSPYTVTGNTTLLSDVTLNVDQGVEVLVTPNINFVILGKLLAIGTENDSIIIGSTTSENWSGFSMPASYSDTTIFQYVIFLNAEPLFWLASGATGNIQLSNCRLFGLTMGFQAQGGNYTDTKVEVDSCLIVSCTDPLYFQLVKSTIVTNNIFYNCQGNIYNNWPGDNESKFENNVITQCQSSNLISTDDIYGTISIKNNQFINNYSTGINDYIISFSRPSSSQIQYNTFIGNDFGVINCWLTGQPNTDFIKYNSFQNNTGYVIKTSSSTWTGTIYAGDNWWNTLDTTSIHSEYIYDFWDDPSYNYVYVTPPLTNPSEIAPPIPAQNVQITSSGYNFVNLSWDTSAIGDLAGYKLYYDTDASGYPYANSVDVSNVTTYNLTGLNTGSPYYIAVTTYDTDGNESWYSTEPLAIGFVWHVATTGSDETGDGSQQNPFATIQKGVEIASDGDSVMVAAGSYFGDYIHIGSEYNKKNIYIIGEDRLTTVFSPEDESGNALFYWNGLQNEWVDDTYLYIENLTINGKVYTFGVKQLVLNNVKINNNVQTPLMFLGDSLTISNSIIVNNSPSNITLVPTSFPTGSDSSSANLNISQSTFIMSNIHFGGEDTYESSFEFTSCIFWGDTSLFEEPSNYPNLNVTYCNIQGGVEGVGNINVDPLFCDSDSGDYSLAENSPCVGTGENGANMGALDVGCGPYNFSPTEFSLSTPSNNAQITIDDSNMSDGFITFSWGESSDENGDSLVYLMHATSTDLEDFSLDTNITSIDILPYMEIVDEMSENNITSATIEWTVDVTDGIDTVTANNAPFTLIVDGSDALSALAEKLIPEVFALHQNYPNPFNPVTILRYDLPENANVNITIYDMMGRVVSNLVSSQQNAGYKSIQWNATNDKGAQVSAGLYLYTIQAGKFRQVKKMVLLK